MDFSQAEAELLRLAKERKVKASVEGSSAWSRDRRQINKVFLGNTLIHTLASNKRKEQQ